MSDAAYWRDWLRENRNWGRWGPDDQLGAINLIDESKRLAASRLVRCGKSISLGRDLNTQPGHGNVQPVQHFVRWFERAEGQGGGAGEYLGMHIHGYQTTHVDALAHLWGADGFYNGRNAREQLSPSGVRWGGIEQWKNGLVTRGVLLDIPRYRGVEFIAHDEPVGDAELIAVAAAQGVSLQPGDALVIYGGREIFESLYPDWAPTTDPHPGLAISSLRVLRQHDVAILAWDFMDAQPFEFGWPWVPHAAIHELGVALVDNCSLGDLAAHCAAENCWEFMFVVAPLRLVGGTGSPVNPIAIV